MKILITGAAGMLGRDVTAACHARDHEVVALAHADLDITDPAAVERRWPSYRPDAVVNCAALTDVDGAEDDEAGAMRVNDEGAALLAAAAAERRRQGASIPRATTSSTARGGSRTSSPTCPPRSRPTAAPSRRARPRSRSPTRATSSSAPPGCSASGGRTSSRRCCGSATSSREVLVVSDQVGCPTYTRHLGEALRAAGRGRGLRHPPHGRRRAVLVVRVRAGDLRPGRRRVPGDGGDHRDARPPGARGRPTRCSAASARTRSSLPHWSEGLADYLAERARRRPPREAPGRRRRRLHRLDLRAPPARRRTRTTPSGCSTSSPTRGAARTSRACPTDRVELVEGDIADPDAVARRDRGLRRDRQLRRRVARRPLDRVAGRVHPDRRLRHLRAARGGARAPASATSRSRPTRSTARSRPGSFTEDSPLDPSSPYSASKAGGDLLVGAYRHTYGADALIVRASNNYGPAPAPREADPALHPERARRRPAAGLRRRHAGAQLALRRGLLRRDRPRARARRGRARPTTSAAPTSCRTSRSCRRSSS